MTGDELFNWIQRWSLRLVVIVASGLAILGLVVPRVVPTNLGWWSLLGQTRPLFWALAIFVLSVAAFGAIRRQQDDDLFASGTAHDAMTWQQFEGYLAAYYRKRGAKVTYRGGNAADGGVDLVIEDASGRRLLQAKHWKTHTVGVGPVRELWGVVASERAEGAIFVMSGVYTREALRFADGKHYELIDGERLQRLVAEAKKAPTTSPADAKR